MSEATASPAQAEAEVEPAAEPVELLEGIGGLDPANAGPGAAAFFDVDNTIMRGSSFVALAKGMADRDYFTAQEMLSISWKQLKYVLSGKENLDDIAAATVDGLEFVKGREVREITTLADEVYDEKMVKRLWEGTLALTEGHLALGHEVWLISATPIEIAEVIAARLGLTGGLGTRAEVIDGRYTGALADRPLHGIVKADVVAELVSERGLDLSRCSAYSDSAHDIPMLSLVGHAVAINPDGKLRAHARANDWPIRDYRIRGKESVRKGVPAAAAAGAIAGAAVGVAKIFGALRGGSSD
ncbi:MAG: HAD family hydrolase [Candidatus Nanopelagicales bacterium]